MGLLSSACCLIQVGLNLFSLGCAGFNTYLGPLRPVFLAATSLLQVWAWRIVATQAPTQWPYVAASSILVLALSFLPEFLDLMVQRPTTDLTSKATTAAGEAQGQHPPVELTVGGMGCVSCSQAIQAAVEPLPGIARCHVSVEHGTASLEFAAGLGEVACREAVDAALAATRAAGFEASLPNPEKGDDGVAAGADEPAAGVGFGDSWLAAVCAGLASSSCCAVQVGLNVLASLDLVHIGCAPAPSVV